MGIRRRPRFCYGRLEKILAYAVWWAGWGVQAAVTVVVHKGYRFLYVDGYAVLGSQLSWLNDITVVSNTSEN